MDVVAQSASVASVDSTLPLARELIARRSVTPDDAGCQALIAARLAPLGFHCETLVSNGVTNLWARRGNARPLVCLAGHTDVVPTGPLAASGFAIGNATSTAQHILYNPSTGDLSYDADGSGAQAAVVFARVSTPGASLNARSASTSSAAASGSV